MIEQIIIWYFTLAVPLCICLAIFFMSMSKGCEKDCDREYLRKISMVDALKSIIGGALCGAFFSIMLAPVYIFCCGFCLFVMKEGEVWQAGT